MRARGDLVYKIPYHRARGLVSSGCINRVRIDRLDTSGSQNRDARGIESDYLHHTKYIMYLVQPNYKAFQFTFLE